MICINAGAVRNPQKSKTMGAIERMSEDVNTLVHEIENCDVSDFTRVDMLFAEICRILPDDKLSDVDSTVLTSCDSALELVARLLPDWAISIKGRAAIADGDWTCTLRENAWDDEAEAIGIGRAGTLPKAVVAALVMVFSRLDADS